MSYDDDEYFLPLEDQRVFGAGIKRKRVPFVPSTSFSAPATATSTTPVPSPGPSIADKYLSIVLPSRPATSSDDEPPSSTTKEAAIVTCDICNLPLSQPPPQPTTSSNNSTTDGEDSSRSSSKGKTTTHSHESSLAHQVCLPHSHPPSAIDRTRRGYKYLSTYGWDPDSRRGLGATGQGITVPLKTKVKADTAGLGVKLPKDGKAAKKREEKLGAKEVRRVEEEKRRDGERLREMFYRADDLQKYLG